MNDMNENVPSTLDDQVEVTTIENNPPKEDIIDKPKRKNNSYLSLKKILSFALIIVLCTSAGGVTGALVTYSILNDTESTSTEVNNSNTPTPYTEGDSSVSNQQILSNNNSGTLTIPQIAQKVGPSVVGVSVKGFPQRSFFGEELPSFEGIGSGVIFNEDGYILTNYHVVEDVIQSGGTVNVIFHTGEEVAAKVVNYDSSVDIAVLQITDDVTVPSVAEFGDSDSLVPGELAVAIGNPLGAELLGSVTAGIISASNRDLNNGDVKYIQTDTAISPGNSGGPLINSQGHVIGINTVKKVGQGVEGLGFAVPINQIKPLLDDLMKPVLHIGIKASIVDEDLSARYQMPMGIYIGEVSQFSPAERSGMRPGDIIIKMDGKDIKTMEDIDAVKAEHESGDIVPVIVNRNGKNIELSLQLVALNP